MGLFRKTMSLSTMGAVNYRDPSERAAAAERAKKNAYRERTRVEQDMRERELALREREVALAEREADSGKAAPSDRVSQIIAFEQGDLDGPGTLALFAGLIADGTAWNLQGSYGRTADYFIRHEIISPAGEILRDDIEA